MSNINDSIIKQINQKIEKCTDELSILRSKVQPVEDNLLKLERARGALNNELVLPTRKITNYNMGKEVYKAVIDNPGSTGAQIAKILDRPDTGIIYTTLYSLIDKQLIRRDLDKKYFPNSTNED